MLWEPPPAQDLAVEGLSFLRSDRYTSLSFKTRNPALPHLAFPAFLLSGVQLLTCLSGLCFTSFQILLDLPAEPSSSSPRARARARTHTHPHTFSFLIEGKKSLFLALTWGKNFGIPTVLSFNSHQPKLCLCSRLTLNKVNILKYFPDCMS